MICKEKLTIAMIDLAKSSRRTDMKACHAMGQRSTTKRWINWTKFAIGFNDDEMINDHKVIHEGQLSRF
jgi:hypothetical protein